MAHKDGKIQLKQIEEKNFFINSIAANNHNPTKIVYLFYWLSGHFSEVVINYFRGSTILWYLELRTAPINYSK